MRAAAAELKRQLLDVAAALLEVDIGRLSIQDGNVLVDADAGRAIAVSEVTQKIAPHMLQGRGCRAPNPADRSVRTFGAQCVEIEVDTETGQIDIVRVVTAHDCGRIHVNLVGDLGGCHHRRVDIRIQQVLGQSGKALRQARTVFADEVFVGHELNIA